MRQKFIQKVGLLNYITFAFAFAPVIYFWLANYRIEIALNETDKYEFMKLIFISISAICFVSGIILSFVSSRRISEHFHKSNQEESNSYIHSHVLIAYALAESVCLYGLVYYFMSGQLDFFNYTVPVSILGILFIRSRFSVDSLEERLNKYAFESEEKEDV